MNHVNKLSRDAILELHSNFWKKGYGSISAKEADFIQDVIITKKPDTFLEIGTASGLSTGFISEFMARNNGKTLVTIDLDTTFWIDRSKETGFLASQIYTGKEVELVFHRGCNSSFVHDAYSDKFFDMAFIDANHQHPWPTLDMIVILPFMAKNSIIIHHDLALFKNQTPIFGIGPKYLYDQIPCSLRYVTSEPEKNIFYVMLPDKYTELEQYLINSLYLPWTIRSPIDYLFGKKLENIIRKYWGSDMLSAWKATYEKHGSKRSPDGA
jgi:predicted O-methyltransferase YrrM